MERGSWVGVVGVLASALVIGWTAAENWRDARRVLDAGVSYGLLLVLVAGAVLAAVAVVRAVSLLRDPAQGADPGAARRGRTAGAIALLVLALLFVVVFRQVLGITQRPNWPPPADAVTAAGAEAATEALRRAQRHASARRGPRLRLVDGGDDRALGRGHELLPADLRRRRGGAVVRPHPDVRLARRRRRDRDGRPARTQARRWRRGARDRGRVRLTPERRGAGDVHRPRRGGRADRGERRAPDRPRRPLPGRPAASTGGRTRSAGPTIGSST